MSQPHNPFILPTGEKPNCKQMLQVILDGQATAEQKEYFKMHMDLCKPCLKTYEIDMAIKEMLKTKCCCERVPAEAVDQLAKEIKQKIAS